LTLRAGELTPSQLIEGQRVVREWTPVVKERSTSQVPAFSIARCAEVDTAIAQARAFLDEARSAMAAAAAAAQCNLGAIRADGDGVPQDYPNALKRPRLQLFFPFP
jgi:TPR repeat protein